LPPAAGVKCLVHVFRARVARPCACRPRVGPSRLPLPCFPRSQAAGLAAPTPSGRVGHQHNGCSCCAGNGLGLCSPWRRHRILAVFHSAHHPASPRVIATAWQGAFSRDVWVSDLEKCMPLTAIEESGAHGATATSHEVAQCVVGSPGAVWSHSTCGAGGAAVHAHAHAHTLGLCVGQQT
jgi:hypothetical protein